MSTYSAVIEQFDSSSAHQWPSGFCWASAQLTALSTAHAARARELAGTCVGLGEVETAVAAVMAGPSLEGCGDRAVNVLRARHAVLHGAGLVAAVHHAITALAVAAGCTELFPFGGFHQLLKRFRVAARKPGR